MRLDDIIEVGLGAAVYIKADSSMTLGALGAAITHSPDSLFTLIDKLGLTCSVEAYEGFISLRLKAKDLNKLKKFVRRIFKGRAHRVVGDFQSRGFYLVCTRFDAIHMWQHTNVPNLVFGVGLERSLRRVNLRSYSSEEMIDEVLLQLEINDPRIKSLCLESIALYMKLVDAGVPLQDARFVLPELTPTVILFSMPPRYIAKLWHCLREDLPTQRRIKEGIEKILNEEFVGKEVDKPPYRGRIWKKEKRNRVDRSLIRFKFKGSLSMFAQLVRERLLYVDLWSWEKVVMEGKFVIPSTFPEWAKKEYLELAKKWWKLQVEYLNKGDPRFVYLTLLGQYAEAEVYGTLRAWIVSLQERLCSAAQWEIRRQFIKVAKKLLSHLHLRRRRKVIELLEESGGLLRCHREGKCTEPHIECLIRNLGLYKSRNYGKILKVLEEATPKPEYVKIVKMELPSLPPSYYFFLLNPPLW